MWQCAGVFVLCGVVWCGTSNFTIGGQASHHGHLQGEGRGDRMGGCRGFVGENPAPKASNKIYHPQHILLIGQHAALINLRYSWGGEFGMAKFATG